MLVSGGIYRILLIWTVMLLVAFEVTRRVTLSDGVTLIAGAFEVVLAMLTGAAFGLAATRRRSSEPESSSRVQS